MFLLGVRLLFSIQKRSLPCFKQLLAQQSYGASSLGIQDGQLKQIRFATGRRITRSCQGKATCNKGSLAEKDRMFYPSPSMLIFWTLTPSAIETCQKLVEVLSKIPMLYL